MDGKKPGTPLPDLEMADGVYVLPEAAPLEPLETFELYPGLTVLTSRTELDAQEQVRQTYERIVSTSAQPLLVAEPQPMELAAGVEEKPGFLRGLLHRK